MTTSSVLNRSYRIELCFWYQKHNWNFCWITNVNTEHFIAYCHLFKTILLSRCAIEIYQVSIYFKQPITTKRIILMINLPFKNNSDRMFIFLSLHLLSFFFTITKDNVLFPARKRRVPECSIRECSKPYRKLYSSTPPGQ